MQLRRIPLTLVTCSHIPLSGCGLFEPFIGEGELSANQLDRMGSGRGAG